MRRSPTPRACTKFLAPATRCRRKNLPSLPGCLRNWSRVRLMSERDTGEQPEELYTSPPVQRVARLLRRIAEGDAVTNMARTARELGINRTTLLRLLHALEAERFIEPRAESGWRIGVGLITLTAQAFFSDDLVQTA